MPNKSISFNEEINTFFEEVKKEVIRARKKFPSKDNLSLAALSEEYGELVKASLDEPFVNVKKEAIQTVAMVVRLLFDGDYSINKVRKDKGLDTFEVNNENWARG